jgi:hypothetical protein
MTQQASQTTRLKESLAEVLPWAPGHQRKGLTTFVSALSEEQTGTQAELARGLGNQAAAGKRRSRLLHNERGAPHRLADAVLAQALRQGPPTGKGRLALEWTSAGSPPLLVVSLVTGGRAVPAYWRAYDAQGLRGRMRRYETAVIRRALTRVPQTIGGRRLSVTANSAERPLRRAVLWRRRSFGTQSEAGSQFVERILTAVTTLRQQRRDVLEYLTAACAAAIRKSPTPSLLPLTSPPLVAR